MNDIQYDAKITQTSSFEITVPSHFIATLVARQLGLPMPVSELTCSVRPVEKPSGEQQTSVQFQYAKGDGLMPLTVTITPSGEAETAEEAQ